MNVRVIECPQYSDPTLWEISIFLAGGITDCPNWQEEVIKLFKAKANFSIDKYKLVIYNPRRTNWDKSVSLCEQVAWEEYYLKSCSYVLFWFPQETLCPITLLELGSAINPRIYNPDEQYLAVGCHPNYKRREDVIIQIECRKLDIQVVSTLEELVENIRKDTLTW